MLKDKYGGIQSRILTPEITPSSHFWKPAVKGHNDIKTSDDENDNETETLNERETLNEGKTVQK